MMRRYFLLLLAAVSGAAPLVSQTAWGRSQEGVSVHPAKLTIGTFFSGSTVTISGRVPQGRDAVVKIIGPTKNQKFDIKGRVGPFWMTRDKAELDGAPGMYVVLLPGGEGWSERAAALGLGLENLNSQISVPSGASVPDDLFQMFLKLKKSEGLYVVQKKAVTYAPGKDGQRRFTAVYRLPRSTVVGNYLIRVTTVAAEGKGKEQAADFAVTEVGFVHLVNDLATHRRLLYGILAVVVALFTGAVMGVLFKGGGGH